MLMRAAKVGMRRYLKRVRARLFPTPAATTPTRVCMIVPTFPIMGGILTVLEGIASVTRDIWHIEYLTQRIEPNDGAYIIHRFGARHMTPWYFPFVWMYILAGTLRLLDLTRRGAGYRVLLPQDGVFSGALAGLAGKLIGARVVCIDHGDISLCTQRNSRVYRQERVAAIATKPWPWPVRFLARRLLSLYWPSRLLAARVAARLVDHYLIPGVPGDSSEEGCKLLGIPADRVTRFGSMIDLDRHIIPDEAARGAQRAARGLPACAVIVAIVCRLSAEKGLDIALESISRALARLAPEQRERVRVMIAGDGPLRAILEQDVRRRGLEQVCQFWGELTADEVYSLLGISDIFLYTSTRGACIPMAVLEAMASGCAVIASTEPLANAVLLTDGRGIAVAAGDAEQTADALVSVLGDTVRCREMGRMARDYISRYHSPAAFRQVLLQAIDPCGNNGGQGQAAVPTGAVESGRGGDLSRPVKAGW